MVFVGGGGGGEVCVCARTFSASYWQGEQVWRFVTVFCIVTGGMPFQLGCCALLSGVESVKTVLQTLVDLEC